MPILRVESKDDLGAWVGFGTYNEEGELEKTRSCGVVVIKRWPQREEANVNIIKQHMNAGEEGN